MATPIPTRRPARPPRLVAGLLLSVATITVISTALAHTLAFRPWTSSLLALAAATAAGILAVGARVGASRAKLNIALLVVAAVAVGSFNGAAGRPTSAPLVADSGSARFSGVVAEVRHFPWGRRVLVDLSSLDEVRTDARVRLTLPETAPVVRRGDLIAGQCRISAPPPALNPGGFDMARALEAAGIDAVGHAAHIALVESGPDTLQRRLDVSRDRVRAAIAAAAARLHGEREGSPDAVEGVLRALALGEGSAVPREVRERFANAGLAHLLAVSGLHLGLVAVGAFRGSRWLLLRIPGSIDPGPWAAVMVAPAVGLLVAWVGHTPSASRAGMMALVLLGAVVLGRRLSAVASLSMVALLLVVLDPALATRPAFQLSFAAVAGLIAIVRVNRARTSGPRTRARRCLDRLALMGTVTFAAALATAPLCAVHFGLVPITGNLANFVAVPLTGLLVPAVAFAVLATICLGEAVVWAWVPAEAGARLLLLVADAASALPLSSIRTASPSAPALAVSFVGLLLAAKWSAARRRAFAALLVVLPLVVPGWVQLGRSPEHPLQVVFLSVGHGDSALVRTKAGDVLVDAGGDPSGRFDVGAHHVVPALRELGVRRLEAVVISHPHFDHYGGMLAVVESLPVGRLYHASRDTDETYERFIERVRELRIPVMEACHDPLPSLHPVTISCVHPRATASALSSNDTSVVLRVGLGEVSFLLTGDIEEAAERLLTGRREGLSATVVKAPHHGSRTSSTPELVEATKARHVVFSSGRPGRFALPNKGVVKRWTSAGAHAWWTHHHGAVTFETDGVRLHARPFLEREERWPAGPLLPDEPPPDPNPRDE